MALVKVCNVSEIPKNGMKGFTVNGKSVFIANVGNKYYCNDSSCTHRGGPLHEGELDGKTVTCPWHGGTFDISTGRHLTPPAAAPVKNYKLEVRGKDIWADI